MLVAGIVIVPIQQASTVAANNDDDDDGGGNTISSVEQEQKGKCSGGKNVCSRTATDTFSIHH